MKKRAIFISLSVFFLPSVLLAGGGIKSYTGHKYFTMPAGIQAGDYKAKTVVVKFQESYRSFCTEEGAFIPLMDNYLASIGATIPKKMFPNHQKPAKERNAQGIKFADLSLIYEINYTSNTSLEEVINSIYSLGVAEYAEPHYIPRLLYTPNDPNLGLQSYLSVINAYNAWNTEKGDTNVVIGIADTGTDTDHPDLDDAIKYNYADPINGNDDDNDGYVDNWRGWDVGMNDNNPQWQGSEHGVHVCGDASAETNNGTGVAAAGFNTKLLPVKVADNTGALVAAYTGITYAADHGTDVINCSWGGPFGGSLGQDVVTYATINKDVLVVAAAGNDGNEQSFYPASYQWVLSVAATLNSDAKANFSNYGVDIDVCAPGTNIYSTVNASYGYMSGTSMASPITAGAAAIVKSYYPTFNAVQVGEQLKATCDNIDAQNPSYIGKLGNGRINMGASLGGMTVPSVLLTDQTITDNNDNTFVIGDTIRIYDDFTNYLAATGNCTATLTTTSPYIATIDGGAILGSIATLQTVDHNADPFEVRILNTAPLNTVVTFKIDLTDGNYSTSYTFDVTINVDYINIAINEVGTTITSKNGIGYNADQQVEGLGFQYPMGTSMMYDASLMIGVPGKVSDHARDPLSSTNDDFSSVMNVKKLPPVFSEFDVEGYFNDNGAGSQKLDVEVHQRAYAWTIPGHTKYVIFEYVIKNTGTSALSDLYAGIFVDWDIMDYSVNKVSEDVPRKMGYAWSTENNGLYAGTRLLTPDPWVHYGVDNDGSNGSLDIYTQYTTNDKYTSLSTGRSSAGTGDVSDVNSSGPFTVNAGDSITVAFALIAGDDLADLQENSDSAYAMYNGTTGITNKANANFGISIYPNPAKSFSTLSITLSEQEVVKVELCDILGRKLKILNNKQLLPGEHIFNMDVSSLEPGVYIYQVTIDEEIITKKITVTK